MVEGEREGVDVCREEERKEGGREEHNYIERPKGEREGGDRGKE